MRIYCYIGPKDLIPQGGSVPARHAIDGPGSILGWCHQHGGAPAVDGTFAATWILDTCRQMWIADRHSEHVACARGEPVISAGEVFFLTEGKTEVWIDRISNQSTGYCPEVGSWEVVQTVLESFGLAGIPQEFDPACEFRRCDRCDALSLVKDAYYDCLSCGADLPREWNVGNRKDT